MLKKVSLYILGFTFVAAGTIHFLFPEGYRKIMPPYLPWHDALIYISGAFEILFGIMVLLPQTRKWGAYGLILLLIAVFPANIYMAQTGGATVGDAAYLPIIAWARLPLQLVMILWAWWHRK
jgi:uncharacterized membrane protein